MALSKLHLKPLTDLRAGTALGAALVALGLSMGPAFAEVPGDRWSVGYVQVEGDASVETNNAVNRGLTQASETYFYGDRATRMDARVRGNVFDVRIVDPASGQVIAKQTGLPLDASGDVAGSVMSSALRWMDGLGCVDGCNLAESGAAPAPAVQVAAAPAPEPQVEVAVAELEPQVEAPVAELEPQVEIPVAELEPQVEIPVAEVEPQVEVPVADVEQPVLAELTPSTPDQVEIGALDDTAAQIPNNVVGPVEGIDADKVLAAIQTGNAAAPAQPSIAGTTLPQTGAADNQPSLAAAAAQDPVATTPAPSQAEVPAIAAATPQTGESSAAPSVSPSAPAPKTAEITPAQPSGSTEDQPALAASTPEPSLQEVAPGLSLPEPGTAEAPALVGQTSDTAPSVDTAATAEVGAVAAVTAPSQSAEVAQPQGGDTDAAPAVTQEGAAQPVISAAPQPSVPEPSVETTTEAPTLAATQDSTPSAAETSVQAPAIAEAPAATPEPAPTPADSTDLDGELLAIANPATREVPSPSADPDIEPQAVTPQVQPQVVTPQTQSEGTDATGESPTVETRVASVDPQTAGPTLANARWVGFTPAVFSGSDGRPGAWISGPFDRKQRTGWITDTATGSTTRVTFLWREGGQGSRTAVLSREAAQALGLGQGDVANVAVYLPR